ncbi:MAG TPA: hypothetical protein PK736_07175 [Bacteroidia bacterium]|nr:hypothetical protein [Bacteroidota bacterium]HRC33210.1 hypothetical protein [Bacteroidia bacterium]
MLHLIAKKYLTDLANVLHQIKDNDYCRPIAVFDNGSVGKHVRHILEFYKCLIIANKNNDVICYDNRERNLLIEENVRFAIDNITEIIDDISSIEQNKRMLLKSVYNDAEINTETTLLRELTYNIEHTVHHLALIRIGIVAECSYIKIDKTFGYADSTVQYLKTLQAVS